MAWELPVLTLSQFKAAADLSAKQYYFVEITAAGTVNVCNAATDQPIGVLQNKPKSGETAEVMVIGVTKVSSDAALSVGTLIGPSADGQADAKVIGTDVTEFVCGRVIEASTAAGGLATAVINCVAPFNAVTAN
jgi:hypothetical protein